MGRTEAEEGVHVFNDCVTVIITEKRKRRWPELAVHGVTGALLVTKTFYSMATNLHSTHTHTADRNINMLIQSGGVLIMTHVPTIELTLTSPLFLHPMLRRYISFLNIHSNYVVSVIIHLP